MATSLRSPSWLSVPVSTPSYVSLADGASRSSADLTAGDGGGGGHSLPPPLPYRPPTTTTHSRAPDVVLGEGARIQQPDYDQLEGLAARVAGGGGAENDLDVVDVRRGGMGASPLPPPSRRPRSLRRPSSTGSASAPRRRTRA